MTRSTLGIMGGMGPAATADLMTKIIRATPARRDQDHLRVIIDCHPAIPDRSEAILANGPSPAPAMTESARILEQAGADVLVIACNTAHAYAADVAGAVTTPLLSMIDATVAEARERFPVRVGLLATTACLAAGLYQSRLDRYGIASVTLPTSEQAEFMEAIVAVKAGPADEACTSQLRAAARRLMERGADVIIAGCTEVPLVLGSTDEMPVIGSTDALARAAVAYALGGMDGEESDR